MIDDKPNPIRHIGNAVGDGTLRGMRFLVSAGFVLAVVSGISQCRPVDATDASREHRSGMSLHVDHGTGCEYLARLGGLTPRLDADGRHICRPAP